MFQPSLVTRTPAARSAAPVENFIDGRAEFIEKYEKRKKGEAKEQKRRAAPARSTNRAGKLDQRSYDNGTSGSRRRPQVATTFGNMALMISLDEAEMYTIDDLAAALETSAGKEFAHPKDDSEAFDHLVGDEVEVVMSGTRYDVTIIGRWHAFDRVRYTLEFHLSTGDFRLMVTQRQFRAIIVPAAKSSVIVVDFAPVEVVEPVQALHMLPVPFALLPAVTATARMAALEAASACPMCFGTGAGRMRMTTDGVEEVPCAACGAEGWLSELQ